MKFIKYFLILTVISACNSIDSTDESSSIEGDTTFVKDSTVVDTTTLEKKN